MSKKRDIMYNNSLENLPTESFVSLQINKVIETKKNFVNS